tara:strand:+ start:21670 stop:22173 length:504 start_codon:yes stop_codon:yes gene_type:complete
MTLSFLKKISAALSLTIVLMACNSTKSVSVSEYFTEYDKVPENTAIYFSRGACFGQCPEDQLFISLGGELQYRGKRNVKNEGRYTASNFGKAEFEQLQQELIDMNIFSFTEDYTGNIADFPPYTIFMQKDGKAIKIDAKSEYPEELKAIIVKFRLLIEGLKLEALDH